MIVFYLGRHDEVDAYLDTVREREAHVIEEIKLRSPLSEIRRRLLARKTQPNRSRALQSAVNLLSERERRTRLARELEKIDPGAEKQLAEQGLGDRVWPEY